MKRSLVLLLVLMLVATAAVVLLRATGSDRSGARPRVGGDASKASDRGTTGVTDSEAEGEQPDFTNVYTDGVHVNDVSQAAARLTFRPVMPSAAGTPRAIIVHRSVPQPGLESVAFTYDDAAAGRFVVREEPVRMTQQELEALPAQCAAASLCEGTWKIVTLADGTRALLVAGPGSTGIMWLRKNIRFYVLGPPDSFTTASATAFANALAKAS